MLLVCSDIISFKNKKTSFILSQARPGPQARPQCHGGRNGAQTRGTDGLAKWVIKPHGFFMVF